MKASIVAVFGFGVVLVQASPADQMVMAAMRLAEQRNYTWSSTVTDDAGSYGIEGKVQRGGYTWMRLPMVPSIAARLGREADVEIEAVFNGPDRVVIRTVRGWRALEDLPRRSREPSASKAGRTGRTVGPWIGGASVGMPSGLFPPAVSFADEEKRRPYSNAQFALVHPHDELAVIASSYADVEACEGGASGLLTDLGAQLLLVRDGQDDIAPLCAEGTFKLLIKDGLVVRYFLRLEGVLLVDGKKVLVRQASSTTISGVGTTRFAIAEDLARKLEK